MTPLLLKCFAVLMLLMTLVLSIFSFISWTYLTGFLLGSLLALASYGANEWFLGHLLSRRRRFRTAFTLSLLKLVLQLLLLALITAAICWANKRYNHHLGMEVRFAVVDGVFNLVFFIVGLSMVMISVFVATIAQLIMKQTRICPTS